MTEDDALTHIARSDIEAGACFVPAHLLPGLTRHILEGKPVGQFLTALLSNDLREAVGRADDISLPALRSLVCFLVNFAPSPCWGSPAAVEAWRQRGGARGGGA